MEDGSVRAGRRPYRMTARADAAQATASRLLAVAVELFTERPYEDVSLEEVASRAEVTKRTLIRRFASKENLFAAAMASVAPEIVRQREAAPVGDVAAAVRNVVDHYERWGANRLRLLSQEDRIPVVARHVEEGRRYHAAWVERTFAPLVEGLEGAARRRRLAGLVALTDVYTWKLLRRDLGLSRADTVRALVELIDELRGEQ
jgi:AcrR family transcriptional regulator